MAHNMAPDVEARIRQLPGNQVCCDCSNIAPQWASVTYGALVCLECSGHHRSLGVHLSFVRSVQMDAWTEKQIRAMETSGGNQAMVDFFAARGIEKKLAIHVKYNTKQATYYRERLSRRLEGKTEPPPDPGRYDPTTGVSEAQGAEPLPGETTEEYNARQKRLREAAQERLRAKFGTGGMAGVGPGGSTAGAVGGGYGGGGGGGGNSAVSNFDFDFDFDSIGGGVKSIGGAAAGLVGGIAGGAASFVKKNVVENDKLGNGIRGTVGSAVDLTTSNFESIKRNAQDGGTMDMIKRNATFEEGTGVRAVGALGVGIVGGIFGKASQVAGGWLGGGGGDSNDQESSGPPVPRCDQGHRLRTEPRYDGRCAGCNSRGTRYCCSQGCDYDVCIKCYESPAAPVADIPRPPTPTKDDMDRLARDMGIKLGAGSEARTTTPQKPDSAILPPKAASAPVVAAASLSGVLSPSPEKPKPKAKAKLPTDDDFFGEFGV